jgi:hypothetical protein
MSSRQAVSSVTVVAKFGTLVAAVLLGSVAAGCGGASDPRAELSSFVVDYVDQHRGNCCELGMHATVSHITFARSNPRWALVSISVTDINGRPDGVDFLVVRRIASTWHVIGFGKGAIGCHVPIRIRAELAARAPDGDLRCLAGG